MVVGRLAGVVRRGRVLPLLPVGLFIYIHLLHRK